MNRGATLSSRVMAIRNAKLLIVDDEPLNVLLLRDMLEQAGYNCIRSTSDSRETLPVCREFEPDLIVLDWMMPHMDGIAVMAQLKSEWLSESDTPILMLTADISTQTKRLALARGAKDFLNKPFDAVELLLRINNLLETRLLYQDLKLQNHSLGKRVLERTSELESAGKKIVFYAHQLEEAQTETLERLAHACEFRDDDTGNHTMRVGMTTLELARMIGYPEEELSWLQQAARLHDVGKIGIADSILLKPGKLTDFEFQVMQTHTTIGSELLSGGQSELFKIAQQIAESHHERWDGSGYPAGHRAEDIPLPARIVAVADVFDALTHDRPYKSAWSVEEAVNEIRIQSGRQFDPNVVEQFLRLSHQTLT